MFTEEMGDVRTDILIATLYCLSNGSVSCTLLSRSGGAVGAVRSDDIILDDPHLLLLPEELLHQLMHMHTVDGVLKWSRSIIPSACYLHIPVLILLDSPDPSYVSIWLHSLAIIALRGSTGERFAAARDMWLGTAIGYIKGILNTYPHAHPYEDVARLYHATGWMILFLLLLL